MKYIPCIILFLILCGSFLYGQRNASIYSGGAQGKGNIAREAKILNKITSFQLADADGDTVIRELNDVDSVLLSEYPNWTIKAEFPLDADSNTSVTFFVDNEFYSVENYIPRMLGGDSYNPANDWFPVDLAPGTYEIKAVPNDQYNGQGTDGIADSITFTVVNTSNPTISITSPANNTSVDSGAVVNICFAIDDPDGTADNVFVNINGTFVDTIVTPDADTCYLHTASVDFSVQGTVKDNSGNTTLSEIVDVNVIDTSSGAGAANLTLSSSSINENYPAGTTIGTISGGTAPYKIVREDLDGWYFDISGTTLTSRMAFNYDAFIGSNLSNSMPQVIVEDANSATDTFTITINPASGKYDENGYADQDIVDLYEGLGDSTLRVGDYLMFNWSNNGGAYFGEFPTLSYPNQIKIMSGYWKGITINLDNAVGNSTKHPIIITNWLGQVEYRDKLSLVKCNTCRLTGKYDPVKKTGNKYFQVSIHDVFKYRRFGIFRDAKSKQNNSGIATLGTGMTKIEIDHIEIMGGGYDGINFKDDNASGGIVDSSYVHDNYIHDIKNEGLYMGNTKSISTHGPQQHYTNVIVENNIIVRCGSEGYQFQRGIANNLYQNNVIWSGLVFLNPFQNNQFMNQQAAWANGGHTHRDEIFMGGVGDNAALFKPRLDEVETYNSDTNRISNSLYWHSIGQGGTYMNGGNNGFAPTKIEDIYIGDVGYNYDIINRFWDPNGDKRAYFIENWSSSITIDAVTHDNTISAVTNGLTATNTTALATIDAPSFENIWGTSDLPASISSQIPSFPGSLVIDSIHKVMQWHPIIWENTSNGASLRTRGFNVGDTMTFKPGFIIQHWAPEADRWGGTADPVRLYYCIEEHQATTIEPGVTPGWRNKWIRLWWVNDEGDRVPIPPDDFNLVDGSFYENLGMGLKQAE